MKKFSFKKIITVSLFFTSVIFTSAFTTCFIPTISTSHSNDQPNATKIDLNDYNNKTLPKPFEKPDSPINKEQLITQLENIGPTPPVGWENWECYPNQFDLEIKSSTDTGGSFTLTAKPNAVNYVGSSTATIFFDYTDSSKTDISTIITNININTINTAFNTIPTSQQLLWQLKQANPLVRINELDVNMITARYDSNNDNFKISVTVKNGSLLYKGSVDIYYYENKISFPFIDLEFSWPTTYVSNTGYGEFECKVYITNGISYNYIIQGSHSVTQIDRDEKRGIYEFSITNNPFYSDCNIGVTVTLQSPQYFTLNYDQLNTMDGWSGFTGGAIRFYELNSQTHLVGMVDETMANDPATTQLSIHGTNVVFGNYVKDLNNVSWELITTIESINFVSCGAFGSGFANTPNFDSLIGAVTINSHLKQLSWASFRKNSMIDSFIIPEDSQLEDMGGTVFYHSPNIHSIVVPATVGAFGRALFGSTNGPKNINSITLKQNYMISPYANANNGYVGNQTLWEGTNINTAALNSAYGDGSGSGRIYVKNETLRQEYINNYSWSSMLKTGPEGPTLEDMIQVDPTI